MIEKNPRVFEHWDTPLEITEYVNCEYRSITHLSEHLIFSGRNKVGDAADFSSCHNLKIATGTFHGGVLFDESSIEKIENLHILQTNQNKLASSFWECKNLKVATGSYPGYVNFSESGISKIKKLYIQTPSNDGYFAGFFDCPNLETLEGWDLSKQIIIEPQKLEAEIKRRAALQKFHKEAKAKELPFL
jgi:hypothetical protein